MACAALTGPDLSPARAVDLPFVAALILPGLSELHYQFGKPGRSRPVMSWLVVRAGRTV